MIPNLKGRNLSNIKNIEETSIAQGCSTQTLVEIQTKKYSELEKVISNNQVHFLFDVERKESVLFKVLKIYIFLAQYISVFDNTFFR